jgi:hypothetical protein
VRRLSLRDVGVAAGSVALAVGAASCGASSASSAGHSRAIRVVVPVRDVLAREGRGGVAFASTYIPKGKSPIVRQDAFAVGTFVNHGVFLGAITLDDGQLIYAGATGNQDNFAYSILGGTGAYAGSGGTVALRSLSQTKVLVTIRLRQ